MRLPFKEDERLCASVVKEVACSGFRQRSRRSRRLTATVARLFNKGLRDREELLTAATASVQLPADLASEQ
jgi:hypothetical protein